jgi:hypothetical protein
VSQNGGFVAQKTNKMQHQYYFLACLRDGGEFIVQYILTSFPFVTTLEKQKLLELSENSPDSEVLGYLRAKSMQFGLKKIKQESDRRYEQKIVPKKVENLRRIIFQNKITEVRNYLDVGSES